MLAIQSVHNVIFRSEVLNEDGNHDRGSKHTDRQRERTSGPFLVSSSTYSLFLIIIIIIISYVHAVPCLPRWNYMLLEQSWVGTFNGLFFSWGRKSRPFQQREEGRSSFKRLDENLLSEFGVFNLPSWVFQGRKSIKHESRDQMLD